MRRVPLTVRHRLLQGRGFTLVELSIVLVMIGLLAGSGIALTNALVTQEKRIETLREMKAAKQALLNYARAQKRLPTVTENTPWPLLPAAVLGTGRNDAWGRPLKYVVHPDLTDTTKACTLLSKTVNQYPPTKGGPQPSEKMSSPQVRDSDARDFFNHYTLPFDLSSMAPPTSFPVAVVLVSGGSRDADNFDHDPGVDDIRSVFDSFPGWGDNFNDTSATYVRIAPRSDFDDLVVYIGAPLLYAWMCGN